MKYQIKQKNCEETLLLSNEKININTLKNAQIINLELSFDDLGLGEKIYGSNKQETKQNLKINCKKIIKLYRKIVHVINQCLKKKIKVNNTIFANNLNAKKNNNDKMLVYMLETRFCTKLFHKTNQSIVYACDYLDMENNEHNMCNFKDNKCEKHRVKGFDTCTCCCQSIVNI